MAKGEALLALLAPKKGSADADGDTSDDEKSEGSAYATAARDFFEAAQKGDFDAAGEALETAILNCVHGHEAEHEGDESES